MTSLLVFVILIIGGDNFFVYLSLTIMATAEAFLATIATATTTTTTEAFRRPSLLLQQLKSSLVYVLAFARKEQRVQAKFVLASLYIPT